MKSKRIWGLICSFVFSLHALAATDPVSWQLSPAGGFPVTQIGRQSTVTYTLTNHLRHPARLTTSFNMTGVGLIVEDHCNLVTLAPEQFCDIFIHYLPTQSGVATIQLTYGYHRNRIPLPTLIARADGNTPAYGLTGVIPHFPNTIVNGTTTEFTAQFTNTGSSILTSCFAGDAQGGDQFILNPSNAATLHFESSSNTCGSVNSRISLAPGASCVFTGTLSSPFINGPFNLRALMNCAQASSSALVSSTIVSSAPSLSGIIDVPSPFPTTFYTDEAPYVEAKFTNTGNINLTNCRAGNSAGLNPFSINPSSAASIVNNSPTPGTCGTVSNPVNLRPGQSCVSYAQLTQLQATSSAQLSATVTCAETSGITSQGPFDIQTGIPPCTTVQSATLLPLPTNTYKYADNVVKFQFTNVCATDTVSLGLVTLTSAQSPTITTNSTHDLCSNQTLAPGASCTVTASVIPSTIGPITVTAAVTPTGGPTVSAITSTTSASNLQPTHHILFVNQCGFDVYYGIANGNGTECPGVACKTPDPNLTAYPNGAPPSAYYLPAQVRGQAPSTIDLIATSYQNGAFWPRTGCELQNGQLNCATGTCETLIGSGTCKAPPGTLVQPQPPYTKFEATLDPIIGNDGVYDTSVINGMNVPVEVKGFGPTIGNSAADVYTCTPAGAIIQPLVGNPPTQPNPLGACSWAFDPSSELTTIPNVNNDFTWVTPGIDDGCITGPSCGMAYLLSPSSVNPGGGGKITRRNGDFLAFTTLANSVGYIAPTQWGSVNLFTKYSMNLEIVGQTALNNYGTQWVLPGNTYDAYNVLLGCTPDHTPSYTTPPPPAIFGSAESCYQNLKNQAQFNHCCGCVDWPNTLPQFQCGKGSPDYLPNSNLDWTTHPIPVNSSPPSTYTIRKAIEWLKNACPTAYTYQFDDPSSSFVCTHDGVTPMYTSYQVTFCPGGISGLPAGATEGRATPPVPPV